MVDRSGRREVLKIHARNHAAGGSGGGLALPLENRVVAHIRDGIDTALVSEIEVPEEAPSHPAEPVLIEPLFQS